MLRPFVDIGPVGIQTWYRGCDPHDGAYDSRTDVGNSAADQLVLLGRAARASDYDMGTVA